MAQWTDIADWIGPTQNRNAGGMGTVFGVCLHIQQGTEAGSVAWEENPRSEVSSHFLAPKSGRLQQMVDTADKAWAQAAGNDNYLSIECEGLCGQTLTDEQLHSCAAVLAHASTFHGVPLVLANTPGQHGLIYHAAGGVPWGDHPDCPGSPIIAQRAQIIQLAAEMTGGPVINPPHPYPGFPLVFGMRGYLVAEMQRALIRDGFSCGTWGADGVFGQFTAGALGRFQLAHPEARSIRANGTPDEICGPATWSVLRP